jgi:hypothetical protein
MVAIYDPLWDPHARTRIPASVVRAQYADALTQSEARVTRLEREKRAARVIARFSLVLLACVTFGALALGDGVRSKGVTKRFEIVEPPKEEEPDYPPTTKGNRPASSVQIAGAGIGLISLISPYN